MKKALSTLVLAVASVCVAAAEPSDASVERLLSLTKAEVLIEATYANLEESLRKAMAQATAGQALTEQRQRGLDSAAKKFVQLMREEFNWAMLKPMYVQIYKESFDQEDIDGLNDFYDSKAGRAYVDKMPVVMRKSMVVVQERMAPLVGKMTAAMQAATEEAKLGK